MNTKPYGPFLGINNRLPDNALRVTDKGDYLREATNFDIDNAGQLVLRSGKELIQEVDGAHSLFANEAKTMRLMVKDGSLYQITLPDYTETFLKLLSSNDAMSYAEWNGSIYCTNGADTLRVDQSGAVYPWGMAAPAKPTVTATTGDMPKGRYQVALAYVNATTGEESGYAGAAVFELETAGGLHVAIPGGTAGATHVNVYASTTNGEVLLLADTAEIGAAYVEIYTITNGRRLQTGIEAPMPAGSRVFVHMGRLCAVAGSTLYYSEPYRPGYYTPSKGYLPFERDITMAVSAQKGLYVATDVTRWIPGDLNAPGEVVTVLPYEAVPGTEFEHPDQPLVGWFGERGIVLADQQGMAQAVMESAVNPTLPEQSSSIVLTDRDYPRVVSCGYCMNLTSKAVSTYDGYEFTSVSDVYGTTEDGIYSLSGGDDAGQPIIATASLGKVNFGTEAMKRLPAVYVGAASEYPVEMNVKAPDIDYDYEARSCSDDLQIHRIDPGKGLRSNWFELSFGNSNSQGGQIQLASISFATAESNRRI